MDEPDKPKDKVPIPGTDGWLRVTTTHGHVFYAQKKTKRSEWTMPEEIRPAVLAWEASLEPAPKKMRTEAPEDEATTPEPLPVEADEFAHLSFEEGKVLFMDMLTSLNGTPREVNPIAPWDRELPKFVHERAYRALPTLEDRQDVFNEWCKYRLREKRAKKPSASQDAFRALLRAQVASTRTTFAAFRDAFQRDPAYEAMVRDHAESGAASLFEAWLSELKQRKLQQAEAAEQDFLALLTEKILSKDEWAVAKKTPGLATDPRYDAVGSATRRSELYQAWCRRPSQRLSKEERQAQALEHREAQVRREHAKHARHAHSARSDALEEQYETDLRQRLVDTVRDPWMAWEDAKHLVDGRRALFDEHMEHLRGKRRDLLAKLFAKHAQDVLQTGGDIILPLVRADPAYIESALPRFVGDTHQGQQHTTLEAEFDAWDQWRHAQARREFQDMLRENAFVDFWGRLQKRDKGEADTVEADDEDDEGTMVSLLDMASQLDIQAMESVLKMDKRYKVFAHVPEQRTAWVRAYLQSLSVPKRAVRLRNE